MKILVVDDSGSRINWFKQQFKDDDLVTAMDYDSAAVILASDSFFDCIFLDHDLGDPEYEKNGLGLARLLDSSKAKRVIIHSQNPVGGLLMERELGAGFAVYVPFDRLKKAMRVHSKD